MLSNRIKMRWTIKRKLAFSYTIIVILMLVIGGLGLSLLSRLDNTRKEVIKEQESILSHISNIKSDLLSSRISLSQYLATGNKAHLKSLNKAMDDIEESIFFFENRTFGMGGLLGEENTGKAIVINDIEHAFASYKSLVDNLVLFYEKNSEDSEAITAKEFRINSLLENALLIKLDSLYNIENKDLIKLNEKSHRIYKNSLWVLLVIGMILVLISLVISYLVSRTITNPLTRMVRIIPDLAKGRFGHKIRVKNKDEIGELASAFNKMTRELKKYKEKVERHEQELEDVVRKRTKQLKRKVKELERIRTAMLNMLEDVNLSKEELMRKEKDLRKLNKELRMANAELQRMDRVKNEFISVTAHELKTPLASIHGFAGLLKNKKILSDPKQRDYYLSIIIEDSERLKKLIDDILDLSRLDLGTMKFVFEKVSIREVFKNLVKEMYLLAAKKGLVLKADVKSNVPSYIITDKSRLNQVLVNLVNNAIKYTPRRGGRISVSASRKGDNVLFSVKDTGIGISKKNLSRIFERFYQVDSSYTRKVGGSGLGLAICKGVVEAVGGRIWVKSRPGHGTTFFFTLPIRGKKEEELGVEKSLELFKRKKRKIKKRR